MTYHHSRPSRAYSNLCSPRAHIIFYNILDALAFIMGVCFGAFALGHMMAWYFFA